MHTGFRKFALLTITLTLIVGAPSASAQDDDDDGGSAWWLWTLIIGGTASMDVTVLGPQNSSAHGNSCQGFSVRGILVTAVMVITSQDGEQLCYQLLAQPFIGGFSIQCSVRSEKVIEGLPVA